MVLQVDSVLSVVLLEVVVVSSVVVPVLSLSSLSSDSDSDSDSLSLVSEESSLLSQKQSKKAPTSFLPWSPSLFNTSSWSTDLASSTTGEVAIVSYTTGSVDTVCSPLSLTRSYVRAVLAYAESSSAIMAKDACSFIL